MRNGNCYLFIAFLVIAFCYLLFANCFLLITFCLLLISFAHRNVEMRNYFSIDYNVKFEAIPYIDLRQTYLRMIGYNKKKAIFNYQLAISN